MIFGYVEVSRAPGTLHIAPHSGRHSFDFSAVNTSHHIDHLSFGLEIGTLQRHVLPKDVRDHLLPLDSRSFTTKAPHVTMVRSGRGAWEEGRMGTVWWCGWASGIS
jgi:hypothetical protein